MSSSWTSKASRFLRSITWITDLSRAGGRVFRFSKPRNESGDHPIDARAPPGPSEHAREEPKRLSDVNCAAAQCVHHRQHAGRNAILLLHMLDMGVGGLSADREDLADFPV